MSYSHIPVVPWPAHQPGDGKWNGKNWISFPNFTFSQMNRNDYENVDLLAPKRSKFITFSSVPYLKAGQGGRPTSAHKRCKNRSNCLRSVSRVKTFYRFSSRTTRRLSWFWWVVGCEVNEWQRILVCCCEGRQLSIRMIVTRCNNHGMGRTQEGDGTELQLRRGSET